VVQKGSDKLIHAVESGELSVASAQTIATSMPKEEQDKLVDAGKEVLKEKVREIRSGPVVKKSSTPVVVNPDGPVADKRFMPNAEDAASKVVIFTHWKESLESVLKQMKKNLTGEMDRRLDGIQGIIESSIERLEKNLPSEVCVPCCGTGATKRERICKFCNSYGFVDKGFVETLKSYWPKVKDRYQELASEADHKETEQLFYLLVYL
jgi:hypothetical protein